MEKLTFLFFIVFLNFINGFSQDLKFTFNPIIKTNNIDSIIVTTNKFIRITDGSILNIYSMTNTFYSSSFSININIQYATEDLAQIKDLKEIEVIHFMVYSGENSTKIVDSLFESANYDVEFVKCKDKDERNYPVVKIGEQWWMAENLAYLPKISPSSASSMTEPSYHIYDYNGSDLTEAKTLLNYNKFGVYYNWTAAKTACPCGWHLPTYKEWDDLAYFISDTKGPYAYDKGNWYWSGVGRHLKASTKWKQTKNGIDDFGFTAFPSGNRHKDKFKGSNNSGYWWSSTEYNKKIAFTRGVWNLESKAFKGGPVKKIHGFPVRCIKD